MKVQGNRVLAEPKKKMQKTDEGIYIPDSAKSRENAYVAILVGEEAEFVKENDVFYVDPRVVDRQEQGKFEYDGKELTPFNEDQIIGKDG